MVILFYSVCLILLLENGQSITSIIMHYFLSVILDNHLAINSTNYLSLKLLNIIIAVFTNIILDYTAKSQDIYSSRFGFRCLSTTAAENAERSKGTIRNQVSSGMVGDGLRVMGTFSGMETVWVLLQPLSVPLNT